MDNKKIIAIIPARGGSKGIPKKNIKPLLGKPLIVYTIESALRSKYLDRIIVSTDDKEISQISKNAGAEVVERPEKLAEDKTPAYMAIKHAVDYLQKAEKYESDIVIMLQPTSPLRGKEDIDRAIELFLKNKCESVISACQSEHSAYWSFKIKNKYLEPILGGKYLKLMRQDLPNVCTPNGAIFISTIENILKYKGFYCKKILPYIMPQDRSVDIDSEIEFNLAESLIKNEKNKNTK